MGACYSCKREHDVSTAFSLLSLPEQVREKIWRCLDNQSKKAVRQVCSIFKSEVDLSSGLTVDVDSRIPGNLDFVKSVEVKKVIILNLEKAQEPTRLFRCVLNVEYMETRCAVTQEIFKSLVLPIGDNLMSLTLSENSLMYFSILPPELAMKTSTKNNNGYVFPQLIALEIQYGHFSDKNQSLQVFNYNMVIIMKSFYCPKLLCFVVHPDPSILLALSGEPEKIPKAQIDWENNPLKAFVSLHSPTLRLLDLFLYAREIEEDSYSGYEHCPYLTDIIIVIPFIRIAREFIRKCYWKDLILSSSHLYRLILQIEFWHNYVDFFSCADTILEKNRFTLNIIRLESFAIEEENSIQESEGIRNSVGVTLNFSVFSCCQQLQVLEVYQLNVKKNLVAVGLCSLPRSLERLEIKRILIPSEEIYELKSFKNLKRIMFYQIGGRHIFGVNYKALKKLWALSSLETLTVCGFNFKSQEDKMKRVIQKSQRVVIDWKVPGQVIVMKREHWVQ